MRRTIGVLIMLSLIPLSAAAQLIPRPPQTAVRMIGSIDFGSSGSSSIYEIEGGLRTPSAGGRMAFSELVVVKSTGAGSSALFGDAAGGKRLSKVTIRLLDAAGATRTQIDLNDVILTRYEFTTEYGAHRPVERIGMTVGGEYAVTVGGIRNCWNLALQSSC